MRTTIRLPDHLLQDVKRHAADTGRTLTEVIADALRAMLAKPQESGAADRVQLPTFGSGGTLPGVDLNDTAALLDAMEEGSKGEA